MKIKAVAHVPGVGTYDIQNSKQKHEPGSGVSLKGRYKETTKMITPASGHYQNVTSGEPSPNKRRVVGAKMGTSKRGKEE